MNQPQPTKQRTASRLLCDIRPGIQPPEPPKEPPKEPIGAIMNYIGNLSTSFLQWITGESAPFRGPSKLLTPVTAQMCKQKLDLTSYGAPIKFQLDSEMNCMLIAMGSKLFNEENITEFERKCKEAGGTIPRKQIKFIY